MKILVVVDMQKDFIDGALANVKGKEVLQNVIDEVKNNYDLYLLTMDSHNEDYLDTFEGKNLPIKHCIVDTDGWKINNYVLNGIIDTKRPYKIFEKNGFGSYELIDYLGSYEKDIDSITVVGLCTDICVITNALMLRAKFPNIPMFYRENAMYATSDDNQMASINVLNACQIYRK